MQKSIRSALVNSVIGIVVSLVFFVLLELLFRSQSWGAQEPFFVEFKADTSYWVFNPAISKRIFYKGDEDLLPQVDPFLKKKKKGTKRIFVLGASTAYGFPYSHNTSFPRILSRSLNENNPNSFEIINLSLTAINTYTLVQLNEALQHYEPDLVLIYAGHNEFYGLHGAASSYSYGSSKMLKKGYFLAKKLYLFNWLESKFVKDKSSSEGDGTNLMQKLSEDRFIDMNDAIYKRGLLQFEENLTEMISVLQKNGVPVLIGTLTSNITSIVPLDYSSTLDENLPSIGSYKVGQEALKNGDTAVAIQHLIEARDLDKLRFRAPSTFNEIIKKVSSREGVRMVDADSLFRVTELSKYNQGSGLFLEHVHPNIVGYYLLAYGFHNSIVGSTELNSKGQMSFPAYFDTYSLPTTRLDSVYGDVLIQRLLRQWPFNQSSSNDVPDTFEYNLVFNALARKMPWVQMMDVYYNECMVKGNFKEAKKAALSLMLEIPLSDTPVKYYLESLKNLQEYKGILAFASTYIYSEKPNRKLMANYMIQAFNEANDLAYLDLFLASHSPSLGEFGFHLEGILDNRKYFSNN